MKKFLLIVFAFAITLIYGCAGSQNNAFILPASEFSEKLTALPDAEIIDVRTPWEFEKGHLQNAKNIDWNENDFEKQIAQLSKLKPIFIYCLSGSRSESSAGKMRSEGFSKVYELDGGLLKWRAAKLLETKGNSSVIAEMAKQQFEELLNTDKLALIDF